MGDMLGPFVQTIDGLLSKPTHGLIQDFISEGIVLESFLRSFLEQYPDLSKEIKPTLEYLQHLLGSDFS